MTVPRAAKLCLQAGPASPNAGETEEDIKEGWPRPEGRPLSCPLRDCFMFFLHRDPLQGSSWGENSITEGS